MMMEVNYEVTQKCPDFGGRGCSDDRKWCVQGMEPFYIPLEKRTAHA